MKVLFDTKPLLKLFKGEPGGKDVQAILRAVESGRVHGLLSAVTLTELQYLIGRTDSKLAEERLGQLRSALQTVPVEANIAIEAGVIKTHKAIPIADAIIAATARLLGVRLLTDDPHFAGLGVSTSTESALARELGQ